MINLMPKRTYDKIAKDISENIARDLNLTNEILDEMNKVYEDY